MRHGSRLAIAVLSAMVLALAAGTVAAGNYAEVGYTDAPETPTTAGEEREIRFTLRQHGVTAVDDGTVTVTATLPGSAPVSAEASPLGGGAWVARLAFPSAGEWQLRVTHSVFETPPPVTLSVGEAALAWPAVLPVTLAALTALGLLTLAAILTRRLSGASAVRAEPSTR